jgi:hypothetical protein
MSKHLLYCKELLNRPLTRSLRLVLFRLVFCLIVLMQAISPAEAAGPLLNVSPTTIGAGGMVTATWSGIVAPTSRDWVGLYAPSAADTNFISWMYVSCTKTASNALASGSCSYTLPATLASGNYELRLFSNDGYTRLATSKSFSVAVSSQPGLVAYWKFDEVSGTTASDSSGNGNTGTLVNGPVWTAGRVGNALFFDGINDNVTVPDSNSLDLSSSFTLSAWVNPASTFTDFRSILVKNYSYYLYASVAGYCGDGKPLGGFSGGTAQTVCQPSPLPTNTWTHLAVTYNGSTLTFYRNGVAVMTSIFSKPAN